MKIGYTLPMSFFLGTLLTATSVSISAQTLKELGKLHTKEGTTILGAAVIDDVLGLIVLSLILAFTLGQNPLWSILKMALYFPIAYLLGHYGFPLLSRWLPRLFALEVRIGFVLALVLLYAWSAEELGSVAAITGAYIAGILVSRTEMRAWVHDGLSKIGYSFFIPIFFVYVGIEANFHGVAHFSLLFLLSFIGMIGYYICGFAFQFGGVGLVGIPNLGGLSALTKELAIPIGGTNWGIIGYKGFFLNDGTYDVGVAVMFLFQMVFMDTTATIPTGAMAERWKWTAFCVYALFVSTLVYPVFGNWAWGGGWLSQLGAIGLGKGYIDFAGSGVVHAVGGWCALAGAMILGPRLGKYNRDGSVNTIPGHNMVFALLGCFILAFGWFGFNPGSTLGAAGNGNLRIGIIAVNTMLAGAWGSVAAMIYTWVSGAKKPDIGMMGNGLLAGLVAITAPSGYVSPLFACIIGAIAGVNVVFFAGIIDKVLKVDDPVGAIAVHGVNGAWGQPSVGLFADGLANYGGLQVRGIFFGDAGQLGAQVIGMVVCFVYVFGISWIFFALYKRLFGLRVSAETELRGLDIPEMGSLGYNPDAEFYEPPVAVAASMSGGD